MHIHKYQSISSSLKLKKPARCYPKWTKDIQIHSYEFERKSAYFMVEQKSVTTYRRMRM